MNTMFEESVCLLVTAPWILAFRITDYCKMSYELVRNIHFCSGSDIAVNIALIKSNNRL